MYDTHIPPGEQKLTSANVAVVGLCDEAIGLVAQQKHVSRHLLRHPSRCRAGTARARQLAMYLSHVVLGQSLAEIALIFGRHRTTVSYACALIEDMRDDPAFDEEVNRLERQLEAQREGRLDHAR